MQECRDGKKRPTKTRRTWEQVIEDFWSRVNRGNPNDCWEWQGGRNGKTQITSYGVFWAWRKKYKTHRFAFEISFRKLRDGECALHRCDNPPCCNPAHLFAGSNLDNFRDAQSKGRIRHERGEDRYNARLTENDIREIRKKYGKRGKGGMTGVALAKLYGVYPTMIHSIVTRRRWKHVK